MNNNNAPADGTSGVFISNLAAMNDGKVITDLDDAMRECTQAALHASKKSKLTLELTFVPGGHGLGGMALIKIVDTIKKSIPNRKRDKDPMFFVDENGNPGRRGPNQEMLKLTELTGGNSASPSGPLGVEAAKKASAQ